MPWGEEPRLAGSLLPKGEEPERCHREDTISELFEWIGAANGHYQFATDATPKPLNLRLRLRAKTAKFNAPVLKARITREVPRKGTAKLVGTETLTASRVPASPDLLEVTVPLPEIALQRDGERKLDDRFIITLTAKTGSGVPHGRVEVRRTACKIGTALLGEADDLDEPKEPPSKKRAVLAAAADGKREKALRNNKRVRQQRRAALRWYGWNKCEELVGLRCFKSGKSGSDVTVFRPRLRAPLTQDPLLIGRIGEEVWAQSWGTPLLIKTSKAENQKDEWGRYKTFVHDRLGPFMARCSDFIEAQDVAPLPDEPAARRSPHGDDARHVPRRRSAAKRAAADDRPQRRRRRGRTDPAADVRDDGRVVRLGNGPAAVLLEQGLLDPTSPRPTPRSSLSCFSPMGKRARTLGWDFTKKGAGKGERGRFTAPLKWDIAFCEEEHLADFVVGKNPKTGLLAKLAEIDVRYSLIHGDLHSDNVLADRRTPGCWTGAAFPSGRPCSTSPSWRSFCGPECLALVPPDVNVCDPARAFESLLLDHFLATESTLEPVNALAEALGAPPAQLMTVARCVNAIRRSALRYCTGRPDRLDYFAVLYLTVLQIFLYAESTQQLNYQILMALYWLLEEKLTRMLEIKPPYTRFLRAVEAQDLIAADWIAAPGAPERIVYALSRADGRRALSAVAATRGLLQGAWHHLDVFDHTVLVMAYLEEILDDPLGSLGDPLRLDGLVRRRLESQGIRQPPFLETASVGARPVSPRSSR